MPADDELIDAAPCPSCRSPLAVVAADLGHLVECPNCNTQFRARRTDAPAAEGLRDRDDRRPPPRDRDDDRPPPPRERRRADDRDDRRSRFRDDDYDSRPRSRPGQGAAIGAAVMNFVFAGIALIEGICVGIGGFALLEEGRRFGGGGGPFGGPQNAGLVFLGFGVCNLVGVGLMIPAGIGLITRRPYGRALGFLSAGLGMLFVFAIVVGFIAAASERGMRPEPAAYIFPLLAVMLWLAYAVTSLILLGKVRSDPR